MDSRLYIAIVIQFFAFSIIYLMGFLSGFGFRLMFSILRDLKNAIAKKQDKEDDTPESAIADSSPAHLKAKAVERERHGQPIIDEEESQIVGTRTPKEQSLMAEKATNEKLDKWMPDIKHGK